MKKLTLETIRTTLVDLGVDETDPMIVELDAELNRGAEKKAANAAAYEAMHDAIVNGLSDAPATCQELYDAIQSELPMGVTKAKVQYALTHLWKEEIVVIPGKPNTYRRA